MFIINTYRIIIQKQQISKIMSAIIYCMKKN